MRSSEMGDWMSEWGEGRELPVSDRGAVQRMRGAVNGVGEENEGFEK